MGAWAVRHSLASAGTAFAVMILASAATMGSGGSAQARLVRINGDPPTIVDLPAFGSTGPYLKISGTFDGELDPFDAHNAPITDIDRAPRSNGKVRFTSTFYVLRPLDLAKATADFFMISGIAAISAFSNGLTTARNQTIPQPLQISATAS